MTGFRTGAVRDRTFDALGAAFVGVGASRGAGMAVARRVARTVAVAGGGSGKAVASYGSLATEVAARDVLPSGPLWVALGFQIARSTSRTVGVGAGARMEHPLRVRRTSSQSSARARTFNSCRSIEDVEHVRHGRQLRL